MIADVNIAVRGMEPSPSVEDQVRRLATGLEQFSDRISACRVMIETASRHQHQGKIFHVRVDLAVPGGRIVVNREPGRDHSHEDAHVAIRDAFDAARRRLQDHMRRMEGATKSHEPATFGHVIRLFADRGYGFLEAESGGEVYFHLNSVHEPGFAQLNVSDRVRYVLDPYDGNDGPQASAIPSARPEHV